MESNVVLDTNGFSNIIMFHWRESYRTWWQNCHICVNYSKGRQTNDVKGAGFQIQTCSIHFSTKVQCEHLLQNKFANFPKWSQNPIYVYLLTHFTLKMQLISWLAGGFAIYVDLCERVMSTHRYTTSLYVRNCAPALQSLCQSDESQTWHFLRSINKPSDYSWKINIW